jgi:hypothetical protein
MVMLSRRSIVATALAAVLGMVGSAQAFDGPKYPDWEGQWRGFFSPELSANGPGQAFAGWDQTISRLGGSWRGFFSPELSANGPGQAFAGWDRTKPWGLGQQAPLTPEYQAVLEASLADQAKGGLGHFPTTLGRAAGMPNMMMGFGPLEYVITAHTTHILIGWSDHYRRIFTDGRDWPAEIVPTYSGYSIGRWIDEDGDGQYDVLEVETRGFKGPRAYEETSLPLHVDDQSIFKERIYRDKADPNILHDEITSIDHALTRPWIVDKRYVHNPNLRAEWPEFYNTDNNAHIVIGKENYFLSAEGFLMPAKKGQVPPDLRYFKPAHQ